jgi:hypothetical protein
MFVYGSGMDYVSYAFCQIYENPKNGKLADVVPRGSRNEGLAHDLHWPRGQTKHKDNVKV